MRPIPSEYYGDESRWFIATVVNSTPPAGYEGRVKIRIHGLHSATTQDIPEYALPWAQCVVPTTEGGVSGIGKMPKILPSALVFGFFMDGKSSQTPIVLGSLPKIESPSEIQEQTLALTTNKNVILASKIKNLFNTFSLAKITSGSSGAPNGQNAVKKAKDARSEYCLQFFLNLGYTFPQAIGITENFKQLGMISGFRGSDGESGLFGLAEWGEVRLSNLKAFSNTWKNFDTQLEFVEYELNTSFRSAKIRLVLTDKYKGKKGSYLTFAKYYLKKDFVTLSKLTDQQTGVYKQ
ncbi:hypothetical protein PQZ07_00075 [bacterium]|jgi:hypothetical protein|nr:hypothetical protein [bacterium]